MLSIGLAIASNEPCADALAAQPVVFDEAEDRGLIGHGVVDEVAAWPRGDHEQRQARTVAAASLRVRGAPDCTPGSAAAPVAAGAGAVDDVGVGRGLVHDLADLVIVPAVRVVVGNDDGGRFPIALLLQEVDDVDDERLLVERIGVAGVAVLKAGRLQDS